MPRKAARTSSTTPLTPSGAARRESMRPPMRLDCGVIQDSEYGDYGRVSHRTTPTRLIGTNPKERPHATPTALPPDRTRDHEAGGCAGNPPGQERPRDLALPPGEDPRVADQRLRLLHPHAHPRRARPRRDR